MPQTASSPSTISDHGLIGDLQTGALVSTAGSVDWFCTPRFDSPSVFAALLDADRGGHLSVAPEGTGHTTRQLYLPDTAVLITRFTSPDGVGEVMDFMPVPGRPDTATDRHVIVRIVRVVRGRMRFVVECRPRFDFGRRPHELRLDAGGALFTSGEVVLSLRSTGGLDAEADDVRGTFDLDAGEVGGLVLEARAGGAPAPLHPGEVLGMLEEVVRFWRRWLARSSYRGRWREAVDRSAMTLKLLTYAPTGALVAALTTSLPEQLGGSRNWDYRFTWVRDASFSVQALMALGHTEEAEAFLTWIGARLAERSGGPSGPLRIMFRVDGSSDLSEEVVDGLSGYRGSAPVRVGNGAADQLQLDIYGELLDAVWAAETAGIEIPHETWEGLRDVLGWVGRHWDSDEEGIWETRGGRRPFVYGRLMSWVALDRGIRIAERRGLPGDVHGWREQRDAVYDQVMRRGWHVGRRAFVQHYDTDVLDAAVLRMPMVGFVASKDPRWLSTLDAIRTDLVTDSLVRRYDAGASPDGLAGEEGTFSMCTFWWVEALTRAGRLEQARMAFDKMLTYANHVGLWAEEIGMTGEQLGNVPQAFTHLSLITAAARLDQQLDAGPGAADVAALARLVRLPDHLPGAPTA